MREDVALGDDVVCDKLEEMVHNSISTLKVTEYNVQDPSKPVTISMAWPYESNSSKHARSALESHSQVKAATEPGQISFLRIFFAYRLRVLDRFTQCNLHFSITAHFFLLYLHCLCNVNKHRHA